MKRNLTALIIFCVMISIVHLYVLNSKSLTANTLAPLLILPLSWLPLLASLKSVNEEIKRGESKQANL